MVDLVLYPNRNAPTDFAEEAHFNAIFNPPAAGVIQQLREVFPYDSAPKYLIFDRDSIFSAEVVRLMKAMGVKPCRNAYRSPWQNSVA